MARSLSRAEIRQLLDSLKPDEMGRDQASHTEAMLYCTAKHYLDGKIPWDVHFEVDRWPDYSAVLWTHVEDPSVPVFVKDYVYFHWTSEDGLGQLLRSTPMDWTKPRTLAAFPLNGMTLLAEHLKTQGILYDKDCRVDRCDTAYYLFKTCPDVEEVRRTDVTISPLKPEHSQLVSRTWKFGGTAAAEEYLHYQISTFPSACVYDTDGNPVSWILMNYNGSLGVGHTLPEHRRKGYFQLASKYLIGTCIEEGYLPFLFIEDYNEASRVLHRKLGYSWKETGRCAYIHLNLLEV